MPHNAMCYDAFIFSHEYGLQYVIRMYINLHMYIQYTVMLFTVQIIMFRQ